MLARKLVASALGLALATSASSIAGAASARESVPAKPPRPPGPAVSLYVVYQTDSQLCAWGRALAKRQGAKAVARDALLLLHFFAPVKNVNGTKRWGFSRSGGADVTIADVRRSVERLSSCWFEALTEVQRTRMHLSIGIGTTNVGTYGGVTAKHGAAVARMVNNIRMWAVEQGYAAYDENRQDVGALDLRGAIDAEPGFGPVGDAVSWVKGFKSFTGWKDSGRPRPTLFHYGSADGCPSLKWPTWTCNWPARKLVWLAWGNGITTPIPEIYLKSDKASPVAASLHAQQWTLLSRRSVGFGWGPMGFGGALSQRQACKDVGGCSSNLDLSPAGSWRSLWKMANCAFGPTRCKTNAALRWTGDISWRNVYPGTKSGRAFLGREPALDPSGIRPAEPGGVPGFAMTTIWTGRASDGHAYAVWAGASLDDPGRGGVLMFDAEGPRVFQPAPEAVEGLRIVGVSDGVITLRGSDGQAFTFYVSAGDYVG